MLMRFEAMAALGMGCPQSAQAQSRLVVWNARETVFFKTSVPTPPRQSDGFWLPRSDSTTR